MTYGDLKKAVLLKIDEYDGSLAQMTDDEDTLNKLPLAINEAIRFAFYGKQVKEKWHVHQGESFNALPEDKRELEHRSDPEFVHASNICGYYFEVDGDCTYNVTSDADGNNSVIGGEKTISANGRTVAVKGSFSKFTDIYIFFKGEYYYRIHNVCLYNVRFHEDNVPNYSGYSIHDIPDGLYKVEYVYKCDDKEKKPVQFKVKGDKLYLPEEEGYYEIESTFFPNLVTADTDNDYNINIPKDIEYIVISKACAFLTQEGEYEEFISDSEQGMQMLDTDRGHSAPVIKKFGGVY